MDEPIGVPSRGSMSKALKKKSEEHYASMAKGFNAVAPQNYELEKREIEGELRFPTFCLKLKDIPQAKGWKVGEQYKLEILVEQKGLRDRGDDSNNSEVDFAVLGVKVAGEPDSKKKA